MDISRTKLDEIAEDHLVALREVPQDVADILSHSREQVGSIQRDPDLTPLAKQQRISAARHEAAEDLADVRASTEAATGRMSRLVEDVLTRDTSSPEARLLAELQLQRAWTRAQRLLDAGQDPGQLVQAATESRDRAMFAALRDELPSYMEARGKPDEMIKQLARLVDEQSEVVLPEDKRAAKTIEREAKELAYFAEMATNQAAAELEGSSQNLALNVIATSGNQSIPLTVTG